ncbi:hypothetical protein [Umezawaea sp. Da 62-37]|uniref:hypothetical protein n=1 Tax=Umezawaea sp. Da 62-37 TaxID=3075927 RepID=UPI0028F73F7A|nr:hypothetical protein [Umezawaea sp. Da 62-37]WNV88567.1 hypothetical protein RM788_09795 [Umezawaea sp. Da 62-37]
MAAVLGSGQTGSITDTSDVDQAADELYSLPPADFVTARTKRVTAAADKDTARAIAALRRPTVAAWAVNRLVRDGHHLLDEAFELGARLRAAQRRMHGSELRRLDVRRRELITELTDLAAERAGGLTAEAAQQVRTTFTAAMADATLADQLREARLTKALEHSGFGPLTTPIDDLTERRALRHERRLAEAREAVEEAEERVAGFEEEIKEATTERAHRLRALEDLRSQLRDAERSAQQATKTLDKAEQRLASAEDAREAAKAAVAELEH